MGRRREPTGKAAERATRTAKEEKTRKGKGRRTGKDDDDDADFCAQLMPLGLKLKDMRGDGNCLFRSLADQLFGDAGRHAELRHETTEYMAAHEADFAPFLTENTFAKHLALLRKEGVYAGNDAIVAFARARGVNIVIHQVGQARWIASGGHPGGRELHVAYHSFEHYSSIRPIDDSPGPATVRLPAPTAGFQRIAQPACNTIEEVNGAAHDLAADLNQGKLAALDFIEQDEIEVELALAISRSDADEAISRSPLEPGEDPVPSTADSIICDMAKSVEAEPVNSVVFQESKAPSTLPEKENPIECKPRPKGGTRPLTTRERKEAKRKARSQRHTAHGASATANTVGETNGAITGLADRFGAVNI